MHLHHPILAPRAYALFRPPIAAPMINRTSHARFTRAGVIPDGAPEP